GIVFVDIISNLERIGDHAVNIAEDVLEEAA
ncbi:MAG TPA: PhoU domain-containing protein, partial [Pseudogracilibacillus sp.]|nr:PhoU domain-containing protein [Pseudogracilibacillus sp.]